MATRVIPILLVCIAVLAPPAAFAQATAPAQPPAAEAPKPPPQPEARTVENPYGLEALWKQGDFVAKGTLLTLLIMSIGTWYIAIAKLLEQARLQRQARHTGKFWGARTIPEGIQALDEESAFRYIAEQGSSAAQQDAASLHGQIDRPTWIGMSVQRSVDSIGNRLQNGLAFLATVGSTAPFVGLFGTVWGIYHALTAIGIAGQASIDKVAGPVGEALIMTAFGLAVAVPAVLGYNWLVRRNKVAMEAVRHFGGELQVLLLGARKA